MRAAGPKLRLIDPATTLALATITAPRRNRGDLGWKLSPAGGFLAVWYRTGTDVFEPGQPDPSDIPMTLDLWELPWH